MINLFKYIRLTKQRPNLLLRSAKSLYLTKLLGRKAVRGVELAVTYCCQGRCKKCSCTDLIEAKRAEMSAGQIIELSSQIADSGALLINFTGGEPLLRDDILDIIHHLNKMHILISLSSNGLLLTDPLLEKLKRAGLNVIQISLNSPYENEHDTEIGVKGSYKKVIAAIIKARAIGIEVLINLVVTREILYSERLEKMALIAKQNRCYLSFIFPARVGGWSDKDVNLGSKDYEFMKKWLKLSYVTTDVDSCYSRGVCPAGTEKLYISPYGDIYPCPFVHQKYGNVLDENFRDLWNNISTLPHRGCPNILR